MLAFGGDVMAVGGHDRMTSDMAGWTRRYAGEVETYRGVSVVWARLEVMQPASEESEG